MNITGKNVFVGTSGGINSAAVVVEACKLIQGGAIPSSLHLMYIHINQHSPDTKRFVHDLVDYTRRFYPSVVYKEIECDVLDFFETQKIIPHPTADACTRKLKTERMERYRAEHNIEVDLIGYVRQESQRIASLASVVTKEKKERINTDLVVSGGLQKNLFEESLFPTAHMSDEDCFEVVKSAIGWYPAIYDILWSDPRIIPFLESVNGLMPEDHRQLALKWAARGRGHKSVRVFNHNNCLPCKNMQTWQFWLIKLFFPEFFESAVAMSKRIGAYYGRDPEEYEAIKIYVEFGREDYEVGYEEQSCGICKFG